MVKATATLPDGRVLIVIGISEGNIDRLSSGLPIYFDCTTLKIPPTQTIGHVTIFYGKDDAELTRTLHTMIGPNTEIVVVPRGDDKPQ